MRDTGNKKKRKEMVIFQIKHVRENNERDFYHEISRYQYIYRFEQACW